MRIENDIKLDYSDVLIRPKRSTLTSRADVILERKFNFLHSNKSWIGVPILPANMDTTGTFSMARALKEYKIITPLHKFYKLSELQKELPAINSPEYICYSLGIREEDFKKLKEVIHLGLERYFDFVMLDVPNAYLERFVVQLKQLRSLLPHHIIIAGNVVTNEMTEELLLNGADIVKVGIGSGAPCITRRKAGVGYPQLSATFECSDAAHGISNAQGHGLIVSDGGTVYPSCIAKAFCGGADFVMAGSQFAGFDESGGEVVEINGKKFKEYYGMSSEAAMNKHYGKMDSHRASEGRVIQMPYKGPISYFIQDIFGSLRSCGTYIGASSLKEFSKRATFIRVRNQLNTSLEQFDTGK